MALTKTQISTLQYFSDTGVPAKITANTGINTLTLQYPFDSGFVGYAVSDVASAAILKAGSITWSSIGKIASITTSSIAKVTPVSV